VATANLLGVNRLTAFIIEIKQTNKADLTEVDYEHMHKVNSCISRHLAQKPAHDKETSNWLYSLKNWGHNPLKK
jgi:hypothetical protein